MKKTLLFAGLALSACGEQNADLGAHFYQDWARDAFLVVSKNRMASMGGVGEVLWKDSERALAVTPEFQSKIKDKNLVMVVTTDLNQQAALEFSLGPTTSILMSEKPAGQKPGLALLEYDSAADLAQIADIAHVDVAGALGCGHMQVVQTAGPTYGHPLALASGDPTTPVYFERIKLGALPDIISQVNTDNISTNVKTLEAMGTRYWSTSSGIAAPDKVQDMFKSAGSGIDNLSASEYDHSGVLGANMQKSVIIKIPGTSDADTTVILGSHLDSINKLDHTVAPGADDNASGVATLVEVLRVIAANHLTFARSIEFHAYAAEEIGLIGSRDIAQAYQKDGRKIAAMLQLDMNSWQSDDQNQRIYVVTNDTSPTYRRSIKDLMETYLGGNYVEKGLTSGTSDHKSWSDQGFYAVFPFEDPEDYNEALHTKNDTSTTAHNYALSGKFAQLVLAFVSHVAGLNSSKDDYTSQTSNYTPSSGTDDLKLMVDTSTGTNFYKVAAGTDASIKHLEACRLNDASSLSCVDERKVFTALGSKGSRNIYYNPTDTTIAADQYFRFFGYDDADHLVALRTVHFAAK